MRFFLEIFEFKNFSFEEGIIVQGLNPPRKVNAGLAPGFHSTARTDSETLLRLVKTSLMSFGLPIVGIRGQGYDGAANMAGRINGLQA